MSTTELERRLTEALQRHAEDAMSTTNTDQQLVELLERTRGEDTRRRRWYAGGLVAAAAVAALTFWVVARDTDRAEPEPVGPMGPEQVATEYLEAVASYDLGRAESLFAPDADLAGWGGVEGWRSEQLWNQAVLFEMNPGTCRADEAGQSETTRVECPYVSTGLGSKELGLDPFEGHSYAFTVRDGAIVTATDHFEFVDNHYNIRVWEPFAAWVDANYPQDVDAMYDDEANQRETEAARALWHEHVYGYIAAKLAEQ